MVIVYYVVALFLKWIKSHIWTEFKKKPKLKANVLDV